MSQLKKYRKVKYLGKGSYGAAILVELRSDPSQKFVIKEIVIGHLKPAEQQSARNEADVLHQMQHSNITRYIESFVESSKLYIVMEHADGGDLSGAIQKKKSEGTYWEEDEVMRIFVQICLALKHVHGANILHRDLKSQNIFLTQKGMVKLGDFGIAKVLDATDDQARTQIGTPYYLSPEICESKPYGRKSDVWSLGVVLYELLALEMPFQANSLPALVHRICSAEPNYTKLETRYSKPLIDLCKKLLLKNPDLRPTVSEVVRTDFIYHHISRLLSYTLKSGTGGVNLPPPNANDAKGIDPDEADNQIEKFREKEREMNRQRDQESKDVQIQKERQLQTDEAREKARKIRQEMISNSNKRKDEKDVDNRQAPRALSPKSNRPGYPVAANNRNVAEPPRVLPNPFGRQNSQQQSQAANQQNRVKSLAEIQAERQQSNYPENNVVVAAKDYDNYARREYFESRAAAQAVKAKVEAYERGGFSNNNPQQARRPSGGGMDYDRGESKIDYSSMDPEQRIAMLKAQKEKEKEREIAEKEMQMKMAIEANREQRRISEANRGKAIAFDIDITSDKVEPKNVKVRGFNVDNEEQKSQKSNASRKQAPSADEPSSNRREQSPPRNAVNSNNDNPRNKKGWGPPVDGNDILQARGLGQRNNNSNNKEAKVSNDDIDDVMFSGLDIEQSPPPHNKEKNDEEIMNRIESKRRSQIEVRHQAREVLSKLREQRQLQAKNRPQANPFSSNKKSTSPMRQRVLEVINSVENAAESVQKLVAEQGQMRSNKERRDSESKARDVSPSPVMMQQSQNSSRNNSRSRLEENPGNNNKNDKLNPIVEISDELEDTLAAWLEQQKRGVTVRKKPVKPAPSKPTQYDFKDDFGDEFGSDYENNKAKNQGEVNEEDDIGVYKTINNNRERKAAQFEDDDDESSVEEDLLSPAYREDINSPYDVNRPLKAKYMDEDVEVVGMQCMLAKALMGDDDD